MTLTQNQTIEIELLINASIDLLTESIEGIAKVAKRIQLYLSCSFTEALRVLNIFIDELSN